MVAAFRSTATVPTRPTGLLGNELLVKIPSEMEGAPRYTLLTLLTLFSLFTVDTVDRVYTIDTIGIVLKGILFMFTL